MTIDDPTDLSIQTTDWLFSHYDALAIWGKRPVEAPPPAESDAPSTIQNEDDLRAANEWLQCERTRLQQHAEKQLARIGAEHQNLLSQMQLHEQTMTLGSNDLRNKEEMLTRQSSALQQQASELSLRELALTRQIEQWSLDRGMIDHLSQAQQDSRQQAVLDTLQAESSALRQSRATLQADLEAMSLALAEQRAARVEQQAAVRAHQSQMEQRLTALDQAEQAATRRSVELDELESRLREEFEEQERHLTEQRRAVDALYERCRRQLRPETGPATPVAAGEPGDEQPIPS